MFVFYHLDELLLLHRLRVLERIAATGVKILVPALSEADYSPAYWQQLREIDGKGTLTIREQEMPLEFIQKHEPENRLAGRSLLMLMHFCLKEQSVLVGNEEDLFIQNLCAAFKIPFYTLAEFNTATINNKEYFEFIAELKKEKIIRQ